MFRFVSIALLTCLAAPVGQNNPAALGIFEGQDDVGKVLHSGSAEYDASTQTYTVSGSGENMWFDKDEFHFVWKKMSSRDLTLAANISVLGSGGEGHRKGLLMIRQSLDGDSAYVDAARHGDGLTSLQFRGQQGATTREVESNVSGPTRLRIEKQGDRFYMWVSGENDKLEFAGGSAHVAMHEPFYVGIGVCAHRKDDVVKVAFSNLELTTTATHSNANYSTVETVIRSGDARAGYVSTSHLTSPGWSSDGHALTFELDRQRQQAPFTPLKTAAPVGEPVTAQGPTAEYFASSESGSEQIWCRSAKGEKPEQVTSDDWNNTSPSLSPDGKFLVFMSYSKDFQSIPENRDVTLRMMSLEDKSVKVLTEFMGGRGSLGKQPWSPDGRRVVFISYQHME
jgi:TolB protein